MMRITLEHMYHGAALNQIADDPSFTTINAFKFRGETSRCAFGINDNIGVYLKYATEPKGRYDEYKFTFNQDNLNELRRLRRRREKVFIALVCVQGEHVCCLPYKVLLDLIEQRRKDTGRDEDQYQILATLHEGCSFRVYINLPGERGRQMSEIVINRNKFPSQLFE